MKVMVRLAVVVATLLLVGSVAFAATTCTGDQVVCYDLTWTYADGLVDSRIYMFCLNSDGTGNFCIPAFGCADYLKVFGGGAGWFNFGGDPQFGGKANWSIWLGSY